MDNLIYLANIILSIAGFLIALKILQEKQKQRPVKCLLNMKCEQVLRSKYSKFLGMPLECLGMLYYSIVAISYLIFLFYTELRSPLFIFLIFILTVCGFLFSAYLVSIQIFRLREWCSWCLMSATVSATIFILTIQTNTAISVLNSAAYGYELSITIIYALAASIGLGTAVIAEILFYNFISNKHISEEENDTLHILRQITWLTLGIMTISNYLLYMIDPIMLSSSPFFITKILILIFLILVNLIYDIFISSKLFTKTLSYILGFTSIISWAMIIVLELATKL